MHQWMTCHRFFLRMCPRATQHNVHSCYLMSCLVNVPLSSVRSRRLRCARLCLRDGSAYTSFLRIHTQGSSRQSKLWGEQQHGTQCLIAGKMQTNKNIISVSSCSLSLTYKCTGSPSCLFTSAIPKFCDCSGCRQWRFGTNTTCRHPSYIHLLAETNHSLWPCSFTSL